MNAVDDVVAQAVGTKRAAVADAMIEDIPGVGEFVPVVPQHGKHFTEVPRFRLADQTERKHAR